jgi:mobilization protein NikA
MVRASEDEYTEIMNRAALARKSASRFLIYCGTKGKSPKLRQMLPPTPEQRNDLERLLFELRKAGNNLNQLAHAYHSAKYTNATPPTSSEVEAASVALRKTIEVIRDRIG